MIDRLTDKLAAAAAGLIPEEDMQMKAAIDVGHEITKILEEWRPDVHVEGADNDIATHCTRQNHAG